MPQLLFLKLGGSLITNKKGIETARMETISRLAHEIARALSFDPSLQLVVGHGSGSFGHVAAAKSGTRQGVKTESEWFDFAAVSDAAARLNRLVVKALLAASVPAISLQPSASAICEDGQIVSLATEPVRRALDIGAVPVVYGDVAFDRVRGGTIISTEEVLMFLAEPLRPSWFLLAGETAGVLDAQGGLVPLLTSENYAQLSSALAGSRGTDVTGGMAGKVSAMLELVDQDPNLRVRIFSGLETSLLTKLLSQPQSPAGTEIGI